MSGERPARVSGGAAVAVVEVLQPGLALTGKLVRGAEDGAVRGWLFDHRSGVRIEFDGVKDPRGHGYLLAAKVMAV